MTCYGEYMNFETYTKTWLTVFVPALKPASAATFASHCRKLTAIWGQTELADLRDSTVQLGINRLAAELSPKSVANLWGTARNILGRAQRDGLLSIVPQPRLPEIRETEQPWYSVPEVQRLTGTAPEPWDGFVYLLAETGLRINEALALTDQGVDLPGQTLTIHSGLFRGQLGTTKCKSSDRRLSISKHLQAILACQIHGQTTGHLYRTTTGRPKWPTTVAETLTDACQAAGLEWHGFHGMRRTNATVMADIGVPEQIADLRQGHSTARGLTYKLYSQKRGLADRPWVEKIAEVLLGGTNANN